MLLLFRLNLFFFRCCKKKEFVQLSRLIVCACGVKLTSTSKEETFERTENRKKNFLPKSIPIILIGAQWPIWFPLRWGFLPPPIRRLGRRPPPSTCCSGTSTTLHSSGTFSTAHIHYNSAIPTISKCSWNSLNAIKTNHCEWLVTDSLLQCIFRR